VDYALFEGLNSNELSTVRGLLERCQFHQGEVIVACGAPAGELYFLARGCASAIIQQATGTKKRLGTFSPGMAFGEMALLDRAPRSAEVIADTEVECDRLKLLDFERLDDQHPRIKLVLLRNLALRLSGNLRKRNQEFSVFDY
jgi:glutaminase